MIQRKRILQQTGIFLKQHPGKPHLSTEELQQMAADDNSNIFAAKPPGFAADYFRLRT